MSDPEKKRVINLVPAILTGTAALLAALTTMYVNVRNDLKQAAAPVAVMAPASEAAPVAPVAPAGPVPMRLQLQRIAVRQDGAVGSADWRFSVEADGQPLYALEREGLSAQGGRNIVVLGEEPAAGTRIELTPGQRVSLVVKGWRSGWLKSAAEPVVVGEGTLSAAGGVAPIQVRAEHEKHGDFTFYFSATGAE